MYLTLEVVSPQAASLGADRRRTVDQNGLTIGRAPGNDWVFQGPYISKQHARIFFSKGSYFVESLGRNAIAIGSADNTIPVNQPRALRNGDRLFIDQYEMIVTTMHGEPAGAAVASDDPFAVLPGGNDAVAGDSNPSRSIADVWSGEIGPDLVDTGVVDPLDVLMGGQPAAAPPTPINWERGSVMADHFAPPPPVSKPPGDSPNNKEEATEAAPAEDKPQPSAAAIPDNWDRTNLTLREPPPKAALRPATPPAIGARGGTAKPVISRPVLPSSPAPRPCTPEARPYAPEARPQDREPQPSAPEARPHSREPRPHAPGPVGVEPRAFASAATPSNSGLRAPGTPEPPQLSAGAAPLSADFVELLRGAGVSAQQISPEVMQDLGKVLRVVVEGVMDVLRARAEIKSQFRLPMTRIQPAENNPLQHSPNVESALHTLLVQRNPGFLSTVQSFEDAFADIRNHQMAMLEGVRAAFDSMLESFEPSQLEQGFEGMGRRGFGSAKARYWELYTQRFAQLGKDAEDTNQQLFGNVFAEAYERQLERLKALERDGGKT